MMNLTDDKKNSAKVFWSGRSQAVRLPKDFRLDAEEVRIRRHGNALILEPLNSDWLWLDKLEALDKDFSDAATEKSATQMRPELDTLFAEKK